MTKSIDSNLNFLLPNLLITTLPNSRVKDPGYVCRSEDQDSVVVVSDALHLDEELRLDPSRRLALVVRTRRAKGIDLV